MNKVALINAVAEKVGLSKKAVETVLDGVLGVITERIKAGEAVHLTGFGKFFSHLRTARLGVDPLNPTQKIQMPAVLIPKFKSGKALKDTLKDNSKN